jgi:Zn-dependent protease
VHEFAHGWVANQCGDATAKMLGRLTLNPVKHIDPIGTILVPAILYFTGVQWEKSLVQKYLKTANPLK